MLSSGIKIILSELAIAVLTSFAMAKIPDFVGEISTGKNQMGLLQLSLFLAVFSFWGLFCIFVGILKKKKS